jgi:hypothetical protein
MQFPADGSQYLNVVTTVSAWHRTSLNFAAAASVVVGELGGGGHCEPGPGDDCMQCRQERVAAAVAEVEHPAPVRMRSFVSLTTRPMRPLTTVAVAGLVSYGKEAAWGSGRPTSASTLSSRRRRLWHRATSSSSSSPAIRRHRLR